MPTDAEKRQEARRRALVNDYKTLFDTKRGHRVFCDLLRRCHVFETTFTGNSATYFREGERNIGLYLLSMREMADYEGLQETKQEMSDFMKELYTDE